MRLAAAAALTVATVAVAVGVVLYEMFSAWECGEFDWAELSEYDDDDWWVDQ